MSTIDLYGIPNCDTVKKARVWLDAHGLEYTFHDYKKAALIPTSSPAGSRQQAWMPW